jgi:hypothetical protein
MFKNHVVDWKDQMNFFDSEFARYARATMKRRRGWGLLIALVVCWLVVGTIGYGVYLLIRNSVGA